MPTYDYRCENCGHEFEEFQSITAKPFKKCPECGKNRLRRLIGAGAGVIFKGSGFYETDYRSDSYQKAAKAEKDNGSTKSDKSAKSETSSSGGEKKSSETKTPAADSSKSAAAKKATPAKSD